MHKELMSKNLEDVKLSIATIEKQIGEIKTRAKDDTLPIEDSEKLEGLVAELERSKSDEIMLKADARHRAIKERDEQISRPLPQYTKAPQHADDHKVGKAFCAWVNRSQDDADIEKVKKAGFSPNTNFIRVPFDPKRINFKNRAVLNTGAAGVGAEWASYKSYSDQVFDRLTYENPLLGFLRVESVPDGQERDYYSVDDTDMMSVDTVGVGGSTELNPNLPESNLISGKTEIKLKTISSGYQKITLEMMQDSPFEIEGRIAAANNKSHARKMDRDCVMGDATVEGIASICTALPNVTAWNIDELEELWDSVPEYYRNECLFVSNSGTKSAVRRALKDLNGRTYFDKTVVANLNFDTLFGNTWVVSAFVPTNTVLFFNPNHYVMPVVNAQVFQRFDEKFFAQTAWCGIARFGGGRVGSTEAFRKLSVA
jgi:HK97 family phage major capsid protein